MEPKFIQTENVKKFAGMMIMVEDRIGNGLARHGAWPAVRGKTRTARWYATQTTALTSSLCGLVGPLLLPGRSFRLRCVTEEPPSRKKQAFGGDHGHVRRYPKPIIP
jgi:hypothetical protein